MAWTNDIPHLVCATGALGTAAFGLVDATKAFWGGGANRFGFERIRTRVTSLMPVAGEVHRGLTQAEAIETLKANWFNGTDLLGQKAIAASFVKLHINPSNAAELAGVTNLDPTKLVSVATKLMDGSPLETDETDVYTRFDVIVAALLDESYQMADQDYKNGTRALAMIFAVGMAVAGSWVIDHGWTLEHVVEAVIIGLLATPIAPVAKDLSNALATVSAGFQAKRR